VEEVWWRKFGEIIWWRIFGEKRFGEKIFGGEYP
jgi:hypothetical protein